MKKSLIRQQDFYGYNTNFLFGNLRSVKAKDKKKSRRDIKDFLKTFSQRKSSLISS